MIEIIDKWENYGTLFVVDMRNYSSEEQTYLWQQLYAQMLGWA
jgi:hypothetical protein